MTTRRSAETQKFFFVFFGGDKINTLQGPNISHLGEKEHHLLKSALKKGDMFFSPGGFFERWIDDDLWIRFVVDLIDFWQWFCVLDEMNDDLRICGLDGWITFRRCVFKNNRLIYNWCFKTHIIIHIIITYLFILACSKYLVWATYIIFHHITSTPKSLGATKLPSTSCWTMEPKDPPRCGCIMHPGNVCPARSPRCFNKKKRPKRWVVFEENTQTTNYA